MSCETPEEGRTSKAGGAEGGASADALIAPPTLTLPLGGGEGIRGRPRSSPPWALPQWPRCCRNVLSPGLPSQAVSKCPFLTAAQVVAYDDARYVVLSILNL